MNTFANNTNEFFTTTTTTPKIRVSTMSPQTGAANKFRSIGKPKFPYHRTPRILIEQRERERERERRKMHLFSPFNAGGIVRARSPLSYFFSLFKSHFPPRKRIRRAKKTNRRGRSLSLSFSLVLSFSHK